MRKVVFALCLAIVGVSVSACPSSSSDDGVEVTAHELDGTWRTTDGTTFTIDGTTGRLVWFPNGPVFGRDVFDVGDDYIRDIESTDTNRFAARIVKFETDASQMGLAIESFDYEPCSLELASSESLYLKPEGASSSISFYRVTGDVEEARAAACEARFFEGSWLYLCSDAYSSRECGYPAFGRDERFSSLGTFEVTEGKTCAELGYAYEYEEPSQYRYAEDDDTTPGPYGAWAGENWNDAGVEPTTDGGVGTEDGGTIDPTSDAAVDGVRYLIYGTVWVPASIDCPEGSASFDDWRAYRTQIVEGEWSDTYSDARDALLATMMSEEPGARAYYVESSWFAYGPEASHAVIIEYTQELLAWDCRPVIIAIGYGATYDAALANALEVKANNDSADAPYTELEHVSW